MQVEERPRYVHDCSKCTFLGCYDEADLYFCKAQCTGETVLARFSDEGSNYQSGLCFAYGVNPLLTRARRLAVQRGLLKYDLMTGVRYRPESLTKEDAQELAEAMHASEAYATVRKLISLEEPIRLAAVKEFLNRRCLERFNSQTPDEETLLCFTDAARKELMDVFECARALALPAAPRGLAVHAIYAEFSPGELLATAIQPN